MRTESLVGLMCLCVFGCTTGPRLLDDFSGETGAFSNRIVLVAVATTGGDRPTTSEYRWELNKDGKSRGTLYFGKKDKSDGTITTYEFSPGIFDECLAKLEDARFFHMNSAPPGKIDGSSSFIEIHYRGRKHIVREIGADAKSDDGLNKLWLYLGDVLKNGTVVASRTVHVEPKASRIEISGGTSPGIPGPSSRFEWVLEKGGPCRGKTIDSFNGSNGNSADYALPAEVFDECQALLETTAFFRMKVKQPEFTFEPSSNWIQVKRDGVTHTVSIISPTPWPEGFVRLQAFLDDLPKRGKVVSRSP